MYGLNAAAGSLGGLLGLTFGELMHDYVDDASANILSMILASFMILILFFTKIYKNASIQRPLKVRRSINTRVISEIVE